MFHNLGGGHPCYIIPAGPNKDISLAGMHMDVGKEGGKDMQCAQGCCDVVCGDLHSVEF